MRMTKTKTHSTFSSSSSGFILVFFYHILFSDFTIEMIIDYIHSWHWHLRLCMFIMHNMFMLTMFLNSKCNEKVYKKDVLNWMAFKKLKKCKMTTKNSSLFTEVLHQFVHLYMFSCLLHIFMTKYERWVYACIHQNHETLSSYSQILWRL